MAGACRCCSMSGVRPTPRFASAGTPISPRPYLIAPGLPAETESAARPRVRHHHRCGRQARTGARRAARQCPPGARSQQYRLPRSRQPPHRRSTAVVRLARRRLHLLQYDVPNNFLIHFYGCKRITMFALSDTARLPVPYQGVQHEPGEYRPAGPGTIPEARPGAAVLYIPRSAPATCCTSRRSGSVRYTVSISASARTKLRSSPRTLPDGLERSRSTATGRRYQLRSRNRHGLIESTARSLTA
jgi:hypothetical protein